MLNYSAVEDNPNAKFIYTIPDFQNPTGRTMSLDRRRKLVELANRYDMVIIGDNPSFQIKITIIPIKAITKL